VILSPGLNVLCVKCANEILSSGWSLVRLKRKKDVMLELHLYSLNDFVKIL